MKMTPGQPIQNFRQHSKKIEEDDIEKFAPLNKDMSASTRRAASATARASRRAIKQVRESKILRAWAKARKARKSK